MRRSVGFFRRSEERGGEVCAMPEGRARGGPGTTLGGLAPRRRAPISPSVQIRSRLQSRITPQTDAPRAYLAGAVDRLR